MLDVPSVVKAKGDLTMEKILAICVAAVLLSEMLLCLFSMWAFVLFAGWEAIMSFKQWLKSHKGGSHAKD